MRFSALARRRKVTTLALPVVAASLLASWALLPATAGQAATAKPAAASAHNGCARSAIDVPSCGVLWGLYKPPSASIGGGWVGAYTAVENRINRRFDIVKRYTDWSPGDTFPNASDKQLAAGGRILDISWNSIDYHHGHRQISDASIASGAWDKSVILPEAQALKKFGQKIFLDFNHEYDNSTQKKAGSPAQFKAAYQHIHNVFAKAGVHNVIWTWVVTGYLGHASAFTAGYPGSSYVDWIGYDPYNFAACQNNAKWTNTSQVFAPFYNWVSKQPGMSTKPLLLGEYASRSGPQVGSWYSDVSAALQSMPRIKALMQYSAGGGSCDFDLLKNPAALAGFKASSNSRYVLGS
jgi:hypothetical protein